MQCKINQMKIKQSNWIQVSKHSLCWPAVRLRALARGQALGVDPRSGIGRWPAVRQWALARGQALGVGPRSGIGRWCLGVPS